MHEIGDEEVTIRRFAIEDAPAVTDLLHRAYAPLRAARMLYLASYQDVAMTIDRATGQGAAAWVAEHGGGIVGTVGVRLGPHPDDGPAFYHRGRIAVLGQFGVAPDFQGRGVGRRLAATAEAYTIAQGATHLALDTSERATDLIAVYRRYGFETVDRVAWSDTNYVSVVMAKPLRSETIGRRNSDR